MYSFGRAQRAPQSVGKGQAQPTVRHAGERQKLKYSMRAWKVGLGEGRGRNFLAFLGLLFGACIRKSLERGCIQVYSIGQLRGWYFRCILWKHCTLEFHTEGSWLWPGGTMRGRLGGASTISQGSVCKETWGLGLRALRAAMSRSQAEGAVFQFPSYFPRAVC